MRDRPYPQELLAGALVVLERDIAPTLDGSRRFAAILVARAVAVAARAFASGDRTLRAELQRLAALLDRPLNTHCDADELHRQALALNTALVRQIRLGGFDAGQARRRLFDHLCQVSRDKLAETNPKDLGSRPRPPSLPPP